MIYTPKTYNGEHYTEIFSEILFANDTVDKSLVRVIDGIKNKQTVTTLSGDLPIQAYQVTPNAPSDTLVFSDATLEPIKQMVYTEFTMEDLRSTWFAQNMRAGAANLEAPDFLSAIEGYAKLKVGQSIEKAYWLSVIAKLDAANTGVELTGAAITAANVTTAFADVFAAMKNEVLASSEALIYADQSVRKAILQANANAVYRDIFTVSGSEIAYLGVPVAFVPTNGVMLAGRRSDFVLGTDLTADFGTFQVEKLQANSDKMFLKGVFSLDAAVCVPTQKVLRKVA